MFKFLNKKKKNNKGFSLVELVIVIAILAILIGILAPQYTKYVEKSRKAADASNMDEMVKVVKVFAADPANDLAKGNYTITISTNDGTSLSNNAPDALTTELNDSIPKWTATKTKSKKWNDGAAANIFATITVGKDGGTSVKYGVGSRYKGNNEFEKYMTEGEAKTSADSNSSN